MIRKLPARLAALACAGALMAGCGGGASSSTPKAAAAAAVASQYNATGTLTIKYPTGFATVRNGLSTKRHAAYVNPTSGNVIDVSVDYVAVPGSPFAVAATPDSTQTITIPLSSQSDNSIQVYEYDSNFNELAEASTGENTINPGSTNQLSISLNMNAVRIGLTTDAAAGSDAVLLSSGPLPTPFCVSNAGPAYSFPADPSNGFVLPGTAAGLGGIPVVALTSQSSAGTSKLSPQQLGMAVLFDGAYDPITAQFWVTDPTDSDQYPGSALLYHAASCPQPGVVNLNSNEITIPGGYDNFTSAPASASSFPVVGYQGYTYWAFTDTNNDVEFFIAKYDSRYNLISITGFGGDRYIGFITIDTVAQTVTFNGQYEEADLGPGVTLTWAQLSAL